MKQQEDDRRTRLAELLESSTFATFLEKNSPVWRSSQITISCVQTNFDNLFTCLPEGNKNNDSAREAVERHIHSSSWTLITSQEVRAACTCLHTKKWDGYQELCSSALGHGPAILMSYLACLFKCIAIFGHIPNNMRSNVIFPILKSGKLDSAMKSSYRAIALSNQLSNCLIMSFLRDISLHLTWVMHNLLLRWAHHQSSLSDCQRSFVVL